MESQVERCAVCRALNKMCGENCKYAKYFGPDDAGKFAAVQRVFGLSKFTRLVNGVNESNRRRAAATLICEAERRQQDPVNGCYGVIELLHEEIPRLREGIQRNHEELMLWKAELAIMKLQLDCLKQQLLRMAMTLDGYGRGDGILNDIGSSTARSSSSFVQGVGSHMQYQMLQQQQHRIMLNAEGYEPSVDTSTAGVGHPIQHQQQQPLQRTQQESDQIPQQQHEQHERSGYFDSTSGAEHGTDSTRPEIWRAVWQRDS